MKLVFAVLGIFTVLAYWIGLVPTIVSLVLILCVWGLFLKWLGMGIVLVFILASPVYAQDCLETGDCQLAHSPGKLRIGCIGSDSDECRWTTLDYSLQGVATGLQLLDFGQTFAHAGDPDFRETNALLGAHPSKAKVAAYGITAVALHLAGSAILPRPWRTIWQSVGIGFEANTMLVWVSFYQ